MRQLHVRLAGVEDDERLALHAELAGLAPTRRERGLTNMRERARAIGGMIRIETAPSAGA